MGWVQEWHQTRFQLFVWTKEILGDKDTHQVLLQLFVVGDDAVVDDDKLWGKAARVNRLDKGVKGQKTCLNIHWNNLLSCYWFEFMLLTFVFLKGSIALKKDLPQK